MFAEREHPFLFASIILNMNMEVTMCYYLQNPDEGEYILEKVSFGRHMGFHRVRRCGFQFLTLSLLVQTMSDCPSSHCKIVLFN